MTVLDDAALDRLFRTARTFNAWTEQSVPEALVRAVYDLAKLGPTSANCSPGRFVFVTTPEGKARLGPHVSKSNRDKTMAAPLTVIVAYDLDFVDQLPKLFPHQPSARDWFDDPVVREQTAMRNSSLQAGYLILAARAMGLGCGPMSGFDNAGLDAAFFPGGRVKSNLLLNIGYGAEASVFARNPRLAFDEACTIA